MTSGVSSAYDRSKSLRRRPAMVSSVHAVAVLLLLSCQAYAAEPVRRIGRTVVPYYAAAREADGSPRVAVGKQYNDLLASSRREDILAARNLVVNKPRLVTPMT